MAYIIATKADARTIGGSGTSSTQCIKYNEISSYNCKLTSGASYSNTQLVEKRHLEKITTAASTWNLTIECEAYSGYLDQTSINSCTSWCLMHLQTASTSSPGNTSMTNIVSGTSNMLQNTTQLRVNNVNYDHDEGALYNVLNDMKLAESWYIETPSQAGTSINTVDFPSLNLYVCAYSKTNTTICYLKAVTAMYVTRS